MKKKVLKKDWDLKKEDFLKHCRGAYSRENERWYAVYWMWQGISQSEVARRLNRSRPTIQAWRENFEAKGVEGLVYKRSGGKQRILTTEEEKTLGDLVFKKTYSSENILSKERWTNKKVQEYCCKEFKKNISEETCRIAILREKQRRKQSEKNDDPRS